MGILVAAQHHPRKLTPKVEAIMPDFYRRFKLAASAFLLALAAVGFSPALHRAASAALSSPVWQQGSVTVTTQEEFFERRVRPLLAARCYGCHTSAQSGGLRLDSREGLLKGGDSGAAVVPGQPQESLLIQAVMHTHERLKMPKGGAKLSDDEIAVLTEWVRSGAYFPASRVPASGAARSNDYEIRPEQKRHWAFQPVGNPRLPAVNHADWPLNAIDNFILAKLEEKGLAPNPPADKRTLLRRVTYDLTGLPPTPAEVDAFLADDSPNAYEKVVDRLLASPRYGERWGRHWLDLARYSDTLGTQDFINGIQSWFPYSYTYRDWVISALNEDLPYDEFLLQQLAADRLPGNNPRHLAALGFLTLGRGALGVTAEERMDDKIDVVMRGTQALTVSCARCHNHKFDPIPTKDYYALYSIFANSREPQELPLLDPRTAGGAKEVELKAERQKIEEEIARYREKRHPELKASYRAAEEIAKYLLAAHAARDLKKETELLKLAEEKDYNVYMLRRWRDYLLKCGERHDAVFSLWRALAALPEKDFAARAAAALPQLLNSADAGRNVNPLVAAAFKTPPASLAEAAEIYGRLLARYDKTEPLPNAAEEVLRQVQHGVDAPPNVPFADFNQIRLVKDSQFEREQRSKIDKLVLKQAYEGAPPRAMSLEDVDEIKPGHVFVRGNPNNKGDEVRPQFLLVLAGENRRPFTQGSGRLELARAIANKENPLTARVMVNRVWLHHFGKGIVGTPSDFGARGDRPTHPELLDYLAHYFVEHAWSLKKLHRLIVLSRTYRQSSADNAAARRVDPENTLLWRMNRRRLDFESLRDSLLAVGGNLDLTMGGTGVSATAWPFTHRRTVYTFIDRTNVPNDFRNFDFAGPEAHSPQRYLTTVPQQALYLMNSPFVMEQAQAVMRRPEVASVTDVRRRITQLYRVIYGRTPNADEIRLGLQFINQQQSTSPVPISPLASPISNSAWRYGQGEYDEAAKRVKSFTPHEYFVEGHWRISPIPGDPRFISARLTEKGGLPGRGKENMAMRRWTVPFDGQVAISGLLEHAYENACFDCDGVQAWIVSSRAGELGRWTAMLSKAETNVAAVEVKRGDTIDFVVGAGKNANGDEFKWAVKIRRVDAPATAGANHEWDSVKDFCRPGTQPLDAWERYAQVLLSAVEFLLID